MSRISLKGLSGGDMAADLYWKSQKKKQPTWDHILGCFYKYRSSSYSVYKENSTEAALNSPVICPAVELLLGTTCTVSTNAIDNGRITAGIRS